MRTTWAESKSSEILQRSNSLMGCEETGNCPTREREGRCEGCVMIRPRDYGADSFDDSHDGSDEENSFNGSDVGSDEEIEDEEEDQDLIPVEDQLEVEEQE